MKKVFFWIFYLSYLSFFNIFLTIVKTYWTFNDKFYQFIASFNVKNEWILRKLMFLLTEFPFILITLIISYFVSKAIIRLYTARLDVIFYFGLLFNLFRKKFRRRRNEKNIS